MRVPQLGRSRPINVCIVCPRYMTGGQAVAARTLSSGFKGESGVHIEMQPIDPRIPAPIARIRGLRTLARLPFFLFGLTRRVLRADVIHVFSAAFWPFLLTTTPSILIGRALRRKVVLNYHDGRAADHLPNRWVRWVVRQASVVVVPSDFLAGVFRSFDLPALTIGNVVDSELFPFRARRSLLPVLVTSRSLEPLYAVDNTLRAFAMVQAVYPQARLIVIGDGSQMTLLQTLVTQENIKGVEFVGDLPHSEIGSAYARADIFVNSSRFDNMPLSLMEAFSSGLAVVTTNAGGIPYIVEHERNGLLVEIDNPAAMADAVLSLLETPQLAGRLIDEARRDCTEKYSWEAVHTSWKDLYIGLCANPGAAHVNEAVNEGVSRLDIA